MNFRKFLILILTVGASSSVAQDRMENALGMTFSRVPAGDFLMGTPDLESVLKDHPSDYQRSIDNETPAHRVTLSRDFWMGTTEVTQKHWLTVMENRPGPDVFWNMERWQELPVLGINWFMATRFTEELSKLDPDYDYRLPTEAEWEYAARAGSEGSVPDGPLTQHGFFIDNSGDRPQPVATLEPNAFGLHDMLGNAWEWVADVYAPDSYRQGNRTDPLQSGDSRYRVRRGGSYHCPRKMLRFALRAPDPAGTRYSVLGFRVIAEPVSASPEGR